MADESHLKAEVIPFPAKVPHEHPRETAWKEFLGKVFGGKRAAEIIAIKRCQVCSGRLRAYVDPKDGARSNREFGVTAGLRCTKCGRSG